MIVLAIVLGMAFGFGAAFMIVNYFIMHSNVVGNTKGDFYDFTNSPLVLLEKKDRVNRNMPL